MNQLQCARSLPWLPVLWTVWTLLVPQPVALAQTQRTVTVTQVLGQAGEVKLSRVSMDSPMGPVQGWTLGICHDPTRAAILSISNGHHLQVARGGQPADFISTTVLGQGWIAGVVVDLTSTTAMPAGMRRDLHRVEYLMQTTSSAGICFCSTLGVPPVTQWIIASGNVVIPTTVCAPPAPEDAPFRRGDVNSDGLVTVGDSVRLLSFLFGGQSAPSCLDAADLDDDGLVTIGDVVYLLGFLFQGSAPPAPPGHLQCDSDVGLDNMPACVNSGC